MSRWAARAALVAVGVALFAIGYLVGGSKNDQTTRSPKRLASAAKAPSILISTPSTIVGWSVSRDSIRPERAIADVEFGADLFPLGAHPVRILVVRGGGAPVQIAALWRYGPADDPYHHRFGLWIWERASQSLEGAVWRRVFSYVNPTPSKETGVEFAELTRAPDATGDGRPELLYSEESGSGACGIRLVIGTVERQTLVLTHRRTCYGGYDVEQGVLHFRRAVHRAGDGACCPSLRLDVTYRWRGHHFVPVRRVIRAYP